MSNFLFKKNPSPSILSRLVVGVIIKDITRISDIAIHVIVGLVKLTICATKLVVYSIPARLWGSIPDYKIGKEGLAHLGFSTFYLADIFISLTNIIDNYPKDLIERVENFFSRFLLLKINAVNKQRALETPLEKLQTSLSPESEVDLDRSKQKIAEEIPGSIHSSSLYQALLERKFPFFQSCFFSTV